MKFFRLVDFPKFRDEYLNDGYETWGESLRNNGYPSTQVVGAEMFEMDDIEYTHFVLRFS